MTGRPSMRLSMLPAPQSGWVRTLLPLAVVFVLWVVIAFTVSGLAIPLMDPECYSDIGDRICPRDENRDPGLTHLYKSRWPAADEPSVGLLLLVAAGLAAALHRFFLRAWDPWPAQSYSGVHIAMVSGMLGAGLGLVLGGAGYTDLRMLLGVTGVGILVGALGGLGIRTVVRGLRDDAEGAT
ncbi:hypothetical protein GCM10027421_05820 [Microbacterium shaanxiense]